MKKLARKATKLSSKLGPVGVTLSVGNIAHEVYSNTWDAHTIVDAALLATTGVALFVGAPAVLVGVGIYGALDFAFDLDEKIDNSIGRNSDVWTNH